MHVVIKYLNAQNDIGFHPGIPCCCLIGYLHRAFLYIYSFDTLIMLFSNYKRTSRACYFIRVKFQFYQGLSVFLMFSFSFQVFQDQNQTNQFCNYLVFSYNFLTKTPFVSTFPLVDRCRQFQINPPGDLGRESQWTEPIELYQYIMFT